MAEQPVSSSAAAIDAAIATRRAAVRRAGAGRAPVGCEAPRDGADGHH
ncbi:hypothetical protein Asera_01900 [Actinocatenispora sera]|uniref:Uncharacterized protein n=1 Tax=Actinocatenispora sera TaxID=390989 RepID=A0A810KUD6_9ACTN|nr:hypothetical protein Asera_01900 [Actinocatenispora sera]